MTCVPLTWFHLTFTLLEGFYNWKHKTKQYVVPDLIYNMWQILNMIFRPFYFYFFQTGGMGGFIKVWTISHFFEGFPNGYDEIIFYALILQSSDESIRKINLICCELTWKFIDSNQQTCIKYDNNFVDPLLELSISTAHVWNPILSLTTATCVSP